ncbi:MAG: FAD binding domain-containing protein, partial [Halobacteriales archaeon]
MHPAPFEYARADTVAEAVDRLEATDGEAAVLAGGQGLVNRLKARERTPDLVVDIGRIDALDRIELVDGRLEVGALATHRRLADHEAVRS